MPVLANGTPMWVPEAGAIAGFPIVRFMGPPGALLIPAETGKSPQLQLEVRTSDPDTDHWRELPNGELSFAPIAFDLNAFGRMCAKIAHGYAVATFGLQAFNSWLPPYILGSIDQFGHILGSSHEAIIETPIANALNWSAYQTPIGNLLAVHIHLFPAMGQPPIAVVSGSLSEEQFNALRYHGKVQ